ncbi:hypothetical protein [Leptospira bandrabouensis]|uniref:hypothetical protein n=1 Tax=Leptospira bandrabouensis TaxID=2484903 RepID=UPI001EEC0F32|nr:hypothetical protein [Leptospira bandrabouensis]MCG6154030.1 hypothetical protein [Leptospira bandrabouensis]
MECLQIILDYLAKNKEGFEILISLAQVTCVFFAFIFTGFLSYFALFREIKFSKIKDKINEASDIKKQLRTETYKALAHFESKIVGKEANTKINIELILECKNNLNSIFDLGTLTTSEISNQIYMLQVFLNNCIEVLEIDKNISIPDVKKSWEDVTEFHLYKYITSYLNRIMNLSIKVEKIPTICDLFFPNEKNKNLKLVPYILTRSFRPYKSRLYEAGPNFSKLSAEILNAVYHAIYFPNRLFPYTFFSTFNFLKYISRVLYLDFFYFPVQFEIEQLSIEGKKIRFQLFKIEKSTKMFSTKENTKFLFRKEISYEHISSENFYKSLEKKTNSYILKDTYHPFKYEIEMNKISFSTDYGGLNIVKVEVNGRFKLYYWFVKNLPFILSDLCRKKL